jgi:hypothetical protein
MGDSRRSGGASLRAFSWRRSPSRSRSAASRRRRSSARSASKVDCVRSDSSRRTRYSAARAAAFSSRSASTRTASPVPSAAMSAAFGSVRWERGEWCEWCEWCEWFTWRAIHPSAWKGRSRKSAYPRPNTYERTGLRLPAAGYYPTSTNFLIIPTGCVLPYGGSWADRGGAMGIFERVRCSMAAGRRPHKTYGRLR